MPTPPEETKAILQRAGALAFTTGYACMIICMDENGLAFFSNIKEELISEFLEDALELSRIPDGPDVTHEIVKESDLKGH
jgi:hypothetical protein